MWDIFVSHASEDKAYVQPLVQALEDAGVSVWYDRLVLEWGEPLRSRIGPFSGTDGLTPNAWRSDPCPYKN